MHSELNFVYMLRCSGNRLYTGWTVNPAARLQKHSSGRGAKYTRGFAPSGFAYLERCADKSSALRREAALKKLPKAEKEALCAAFARTCADALQPYTAGDADAVRALCGENAAASHCAAVLRGDGRLWGAGFVLSAENGCAAVCAAFAPEAEAAGLCVPLLLRLRKAAAEQGAAQAVLTPAPRSSSARAAALAAGFAQEKQGHKTAWLAPCGTDAAGGENA